MQKIRKINILGTNTYIFSAWEPTTLKGTNHTPIIPSHSTITTINGQWYGRIGTREITPELNSIPVGLERFEKMKEYREGQYNEAYQAILTEYPELKNQNIKYDMGEIEIAYPAEQ